MELEKWIDMGDNIISGLDMNEDVRNGALTKQLNDLKQYARSHIDQLQYLHLQLITGTKVELP